MNTLARRLLTIAAVSATAIGVTIVTGAGAGAANQPTTTAGLHARLPGPSAGTRANTTGVTPDGAGYYTYPGDVDGVASASTTFKMPTITCKSATDREWLLPGIWVYEGQTLTEQVDVNFNCNDGVLTEDAVICVSDSACNSTLSIAPHDTIRASLAYTSSHTIGTIKDVTSKQSAQVVGSAVSTDVTVFIGDVGPSLFAGGIVQKVPTFGSIKFSDNQVNAQDLSDWPQARYNLKTTSAVQIRTGALATNQSFVTTFAHN